MRVTSTRWRCLSEAEFQRLEQAAEQVFGPRADVLAVYLYGSAARGAAARDLDVAVLFREPFEPRDLERLAASLQVPFVRLAQDGVLTLEQSVALQGWAGLRNVLADLYTAIDLDRLYAAMIEDKSTLRELGRIAARNSSESDPPGWTLPDDG